MSVAYESVRHVDSKVCAGVRFAVRRMSFGRRLELTRRVRELAAKVEFLNAGQTITDKLEASLSTIEADRIYLEWGLHSIAGLTIDGASADVSTVAELGPEELCREILREIKRECGITEEERKN